MKAVDINSLNRITELSETKCDDLSEAASVCLENQKHDKLLNLEVVGTFIDKFILKRNNVTQKIKDSRADLVETAQYGAIAIAALLTFELTDYKVIRQSVRGTGFDYWLGNKNEIYPFQNSARLEISGILKGTNSQIKTRVNDKLNRLDKYKSNLLAYVCVAEFSNPKAEIRIKN